MLFLNRQWSYTKKLPAGLLKLKRKPGVNRLKNIKAYGGVCYAQNIQ